MPIPKSFSKKVKDALKDEDIAHDKKPDIDNLQKFTFDVLNGILFDDDCQICYVNAIKYYSPNPRTVIHASNRYEYDIHIRRPIYTHVFVQNEVKTFEEMLLEEKQIHGKLSQAFLMRKFKLTPKYALELEKKYADKGGA